MGLRSYADLVRALKNFAAPDLHLHAFLARGDQYAPGLRGLSIPRVPQELREAGPTPAPGTSAECSHDWLLHRSRPGRITTAEWIDWSRPRSVGLTTTSNLDLRARRDATAERIGHLDVLRRRPKRRAASASSCRCRS